MRERGTRGEGTEAEEVRERGPGRVALGSAPQRATTKQNPGRKTSAGSGGLVLLDAAAQDQQPSVLPLSEGVRRARVGPSAEAIGLVVVRCGVAVFAAADRGDGRLIAVRGGLVWRIHACCKLLRRMRERCPILQLATRR